MPTFSGWINTIQSLWASLFSSSTTSESNSMTRTRGGNTAYNLTFPDTVNYDLAMDLYYNTRSGYKLGAFFCHSIIFIPMAFMGFPHFDIEEIEKTPDQEFWTERLDFYNEKYFMNKQQIQKLCHIAGTILIYPWFDLKAGYVKWLFIKPKYITDVFVNPDTHELTGIVTTINYTFYGEDGKYYYFTEKKKFTAKKIITTRTGNIPPNVRELEIRKNPAGILPVVFTNDVEPGEFEGHSEFERILPIVKAYSEINLRAHEEAANMKAKLIQNVDDYKTWMKNNGFDDISDVSIENVDFIINKGDTEKTEIIVPKNLIDNHIKLMNLDFWGVVEGSGIPEICWGLKTEGNHASAKEQMMVFLSYVSLKQKQVENPYLDLINATFKLEAIAYNQTPPEDVINRWNELDAMTEVERSEIFSNWATGLQKLIDSHAIDLQGVHEILLSLTKDLITSDFEEFKKQLTEYGTLRGFLDAGFNGQMDFQDQEMDLAAADQPPKAEKMQRNGVK